jgi:hypothetical protein
MLGLIAAAAATPRVRAANATLDLSNASEQLEVYVRIRGRLAGPPVFDHVTGSVYSAVDGEQPLLLFGLEGLQVSLYRREAADRFVVRTRYLGLRTDPASGRILERFANPWTGAMDDVPVTSYGPSTIRIHPDGIDFGVPQEQAPRVSRRRFQRTAGWIHVSEAILSAASTDQPDFDEFTFSAQEADLAVGASGFVPAIAAFTVVERWPSWMRMGNRPGMLVWHVRGTKFEHAEEVPASLRREAERRWGGPIERVFSA